ncbi:hypothetical protein D3C81_1284910 [compost metagenome]
MASQEVLGESFRTFQLSGASGRTEAIQATGTEQVNDASDQWHFRANDGQGNVFLGKVRQLLKGEHVDGDVLALGFDGGTSVAWSDEYLLYTRILSHFPGQGVFTATAANDQNIHFKNLGCGSKACPRWRSWGRHRGQALLLQVCALQA